ncbi:MAG: hypothetical protein LBB88_06525 [Planctomycetaceae bacterium]|jgi:hypothetical protein|nr:hypothetical protein [Planctomycetaceae bacterium]
MKKLLTLAFVAALSFVGSMVYAEETATVATANEAPIVIAPGFGQHGLPYGDHYYTGYEGIPGQKVNLLTKIGNKLKAAKAAREARKAAQGYGFDGGYPAPRRKLFTPRARANFGGGIHGFNGPHGGYPTEFQVGGYY